MSALTGTAIVKVVPRLRALWVWTVPPSFSAVARTTSRPTPRPETRVTTLRVVKPDEIVDIATLTGAAVAALGPKIAAVIGNDQPFVDKVKAAAGRTDESMWQLPLAKEYRKFLDSQVADMKNVGGPYGGAITAALFLKRPPSVLDVASGASGGRGLKEGDELIRSLIDLQHFSQIGIERAVSRVNRIERGLQIGGLHPPQRAH